MSEEYTRLPHSYVCRKTAADKLTCPKCIWDSGRASRDGLRSQLVSNNTVLFDVASLVVCGKYFDAIELCHAKVFGNNQALEDDGEGR